MGGQKDMTVSEQAGRTLAQVCAASRFSAATNKSMH